MNLIYDRAEADAAEAVRIERKLHKGEALTDAETAAWNAGMKGGYNASDMNRVESAVKLLAAELNSAGYPVEISPVLKGDSRVPEGYTEVEWIQSSGTQYVDSGVIETDDTAIDCCFDVDTVASDYLFGSRQNGNNMSYNGVYKNNVLEYNYNEINFTASDSIKIEQRVTGATNEITINGVSHTLSTGTPQNVSMLIFGIRRNTGAMRPYGGQAKLRYFKIKKSSNTVRDFVPCKNSSGAVGLYDTVSKTFFTNAGTGSFTAGSDVGSIEDRNWLPGDTVTRDQWETYLDNVRRLRKAYYVLAETGAIPELTDRLSWEGANSIEKTLSDIDLLLAGMSSMYRKAGTFTAGNIYLRQITRSI